MILLSTAPSDKALNLANELIDKKAAVCVNLVPNINSVYVWKGEKISDNESLLIIKGKFKKVHKIFKNLHPYEVFELAKINAKFNKKYAIWLKSTLKIKKGKKC